MKLILRTAKSIVCLIRGHVKDEANVGAIKYCKRCKRDLRENFSIKKLINWAIDRLFTILDKLFEGVFNDEEK